MMMDAPSEGLTHKDHQAHGQMVLEMITLLLLMFTINGPGVTMVVLVALIIEQYGNG